LDIYSEGDALGYDGSGRWPECAKVDLNRYITNNLIPLPRPFATLKTFKLYEIEMSPGKKITSAL